MGAGGPMKPTWWQLYGLGVLLVALIGAIEVGVPPGALRTILESAAVILGFGLMLIWRRHNRVALDLATPAPHPSRPQPLECGRAPGRYTRAVGTNRPDPEALLARVKAEEARQRRGKLKVFLGAAAGVGKTYAMLEAVREQKADAVDVLVGYVETHGRAETDALLAGLELLPARMVDYRGTALREFDLDAA